jgi:hypothetical protein
MHDGTQLLAMPSLREDPPQWKQRIRRGSRVAPLDTVIHRQCRSFSATLTSTFRWLKESGSKVLTPGSLPAQICRFYDLGGNSQSI